VNALGIFLIWCRHTYHAAALNQNEIHASFVHAA
jgi:hypothetical protein